MVRALLCFLLLVSLLAPNPFGTTSASGRAEAATLPIGVVERWLGAEGVHDAYIPRSPVGLPEDLGRFLSEDAPLTRAKVELGRQLFFDSRLGADGDRACSTCHQPAHAWSDGRAKPPGLRPGFVGRNAPSLVNVLLDEGPGFDLEARTLGALTSPLELGSSFERITALVRGTEGYARQFDAVFGGPARPEHVAAALAAFQRTLLAGGSPYDHQVLVEALPDPADLAGDAEGLRHREEVLDAAERHRMGVEAEAGRLVFDGLAGCVSCHHGPGLRDGRTHALPGQDGSGRGSRPTLRTPTLRDIARTAPYLHDGSAETLELALARHPFAARAVTALDEVDRRALLAFLREGLSGTGVDVGVPRLP